MKSKKGPMGFDEHAKKNYAHFDRRVSYNQIRHLAENPDAVAKHGFLPLISTVITNVKYNSDKRAKKPKNRHIAYASHVDRCIYQRYSYLLNEKYNQVSRNRLLDGVSIAYRNNQHKSNIDYAYQAFSQMVKMGTCYVLVADFKDFFDSLDHRALKNQMRQLFDDAIIPDDYYAIYKSVVHWSQWDLGDLMLRDGLITNRVSSIRAFNKKERAISPEKFHAEVKDKAAQPWKETNAGIPQGLPVSGVLANIFMIDFDARMSKVVSAEGGFYLRYSDDIFMCLPRREAFSACGELLDSLCSQYGLTIEKDKTSCYSLRDDVIYDLNKGEVKSKVQYLGFDFDGRSVSMRQRTIGRFYTKMHRAVLRTFYDSPRPSKKRVKELYLRYSEKGCRGESGNFLTYAHRAEKKFGAKSARNRINADVKNHYLKLKRDSQRQIMAFDDER